MTIQHRSLDELARPKARWSAVCRAGRARSAPAAAVAASSRAQAPAQAVASRMAPSVRIVGCLWLIASLGCGLEPLSPPATPAESCSAAACHGAIENIHYGGPPLACVDCHLGDPTRATKEGAHVTVDTSFNPSTPGANYLADPTLAQLDALPEEVLQFINPADYRVVRNSCGRPMLNGVGCHQTISENSLILNRATLAGTYAGGGFIASVQDKAARYGVVATGDPHVAEHLPNGIIAALAALPADPPASVSDPVGRAWYPVFEQLCTECHLNQDGPHEPGRYYSSGCNGCHMVTDDDGRTRTGDATQDIDERGHVRQHHFTNKVPDSQCAHCHTSHLARSMLARGVRERSNPAGDQAIGGPNRGVEDPQHHVAWGAENYVKHNGELWNYGKQWPFYIEDEDGTNEVDETPADIHTARGMACIDCHNAREMHGDKHMAERMDFELDVRCANCHGRPGELGKLESDAGIVFTVAGTAVGGRGNNDVVFSTGLDGSILQRGKIDQIDHPVTQITRRTDPTLGKYNQRTRMGCELHAGTAEVRKALKAAVNALAATDPVAVAEQYPGLPAGFTFDETPDQETDGRTACFTCHNAWTVNCYGCHISRDDRQTYTSRIDGKVKKGRMTVHELSVVADALSLGFNARGRISPMVGTSIFFTHIDENGARPIDAQPLRSADGLVGEGNVHNPVHHHTVQRQPRDCNGCHPSASGGQDDAALLRAVGLGSGQFTFVDGAGKTHLLDRLVLGDWDGDGSWDDPVAMGLPEALSAVQAVVGTTHVARSTVAGQSPPGPLDKTTINRVVGNRVVPQRPKSQ